MRTPCIALFAALCIVAVPAFAQDEIAPVARDNRDNRDFAMIGVGAAVLPDYEGSNDYRFAPVPFAVGKLSGFGFELAGTRLSVDLVPDRSASGLDFQAGPTVNVNFNRTSIGAIEDPRIRALGKLDAARASLLPAYTSRVSHLHLP